MTTTESPAGSRVVLPATLEARLRAFRNLVWRTKLVEAGCGAAAGVLLGFLAVFVSDRLTETPAWVRAAVFAAAVVGCAAVPLAFRRWIWRHRSLEQLARLVARRFPGFGDELLGIVEISREAATGRSLGRSQALCAAAIGQVAARAEAVDFTAAVPPARTRLWAALAAVPLVAALGLAGAVPAAAANAWARFLMPWRSIDRFTFTRLEPVPERIVVPHGEPAALVVSLAADSERRPRTARLAVGRQRPLVVSSAAEAAGDAPSFAFAIPPQLEAAPLRLAIGDARVHSRLEPLLRPEITAVEAEIRLPGYLGRPEPVEQDVRGGTVTAVIGSDVALEVTASRELAAARVGDVAVAPAGAVVRTPPLPVTESTQLTIAWEDVHGLAGTRPLEIAIAAKPDAAPTVALLGTPPNRSMLLDVDTLRFQVAARDDFGIRRVGIQWEPAAAAADTAATAGDRPLAAGGHAEESLDVAATFCPQALGIPPQPILLRAFVEDYVPGRGRVTSPPLLLYVVDKAEHALVMNERLNRWRQRAGEVRDREMQLLATNRELRRLPEEKLLEAETRRSIEAQAAAEDANARRLGRLVDEGADLVREALKNSEFEAATLDQLATDIQTLADIADARMPGVADLLRAAAEARLAKAGTPAAAEESGDPPPKVGEDRGGAGGGGQPQEPGEPQPPLPQVVDRESSQQPSSGEPEEAGQPGGGQGRLGLPTTQAGVAPRPPREDEPPAAAEALDDAIAGQEALLAEFAKVAEDLAAVMARLEGSTFVKRFKLASREQAALGGRIARFSAEAFGRPDRRPLEVVRAVGDAVESSGREVEKVSNLLDDMQAYFERRQLPAFRTVLEEMKDLDALGSLRQLTDDIRTEAGMSIAQAEFWSDTFDRLADELVPPPGDGQESGEGQPAASLPPEVVLEAMRILEAEVNLREETRVTERSRSVIDAAAFAARAAALAAEQETLADRVASLAETLIDAPVGGPLFGKDVPLFGPLAVPDGQEVYRREIAVFDLVEEVMLEAGGILRTPDTGSKAIGAQTEAIELLLASQAAGGGGGGGGGGGAGTVGAGGATGTTRTPALALVGRGNRAKAADGEGEKEQATGTGGRVLPEEFRAGLDAYFNRFEKERP